MCDFATPMNTTGMGNVSFPSHDNSEFGSEPICVMKKCKKRKRKMKSIKECINEGLTTKQSEIVGKLFIKMFSHTKITKDQLVMMLTNINDISIIQKIEQYIESFDEKFAFPYLASKDEFLNKENHERIIDNLAQYFEKYVVV